MSRAEDDSLRYWEAHRVTSSQLVEEVSEIQVDAFEAGARDFLEWARSRAQTYGVGETNYCPREITAVEIDDLEAYFAEDSK